MNQRNHLLLLCSMFAMYQSLSASEAAPQPAGDGESGVSAAAKSGDAKSEATGASATQQPAQSGDAATPQSSPATAASNVHGGVGPVGASDDSGAKQSGAVSGSTGATNAGAIVARSGFWYGAKKNGLLGLGRKAAADILLADLKAIKDGHVACADNSLENDNLINTAVSDITAVFMAKKVEGEMSPKEQADLKKMIELQGQCKAKKMAMGTVARRQSRAFFKKHLSQQLASIGKTMAAYSESFDPDLGSKSDDEGADKEVHDALSAVLGKTKCAAKKAAKMSAAVDSALNATGAALAVVSAKATPADATAAAK